MGPFIVILLQMLGFFLVGLVGIILIYGVQLFANLF